MLAVRPQPAEAGGSGSQGQADIIAHCAIMQQAPGLPLRRPGFAAGDGGGRVVVARDGGGAELL